MLYVIIFLQDARLNSGKREDNYKLPYTKMNASFLLCGLTFVLTLSSQSLVNGQITFLDKHRPAYRFLRNSLFEVVGRTDNQWAYDWNLKRGVSTSGGEYHLIKSKILLFLANRIHCTCTESAETLPRRT